MVGYFLGKARFDAEICAESCLFLTPILTPKHIKTGEKREEKTEVGNGSKRKSPQKHRLKGIFEGVERA